MRQPEGHTQSAMPVQVHTDLCQNKAGTLTMGRCFAKTGGIFLLYGEEGPGMPFLQPALVEDTLGLVQLAFGTQGVCGDDEFRCVIAFVLKDEVFQVLLGLDAHMDGIRPFRAIRHHDGKVV